MAKTFFPSFWPFFARIGLGSLALALPGVMLISGFRVTLGGLFLFGLADVVGSALYTALMVHVERVVLGPEGVRGTDLWGHSRLLGWSEVSHVRRFNFLGLKWLRVFPRTGRWPVWISLTLCKPDAFVDAVKELAPVDNPVRSFFDS